MTMTLISEYFEDHRSAQLYLEKGTRSYWVVGVLHDLEIVREHFLMRGRAEDWAEDWVAGRFEDPSDSPSVAV